MVTITPNNNHNKFLVPRRTMHNLRHKQKMKIQFSRQKHQSQLSSPFLYIRQGERDKQLLREEWCRHCHAILKKRQMPLSMSPSSTKSKKPRHPLLFVMFLFVLVTFKVSLEYPYIFRQPLFVHLFFSLKKIEPVSCMRLPS